VQDVAPRPEDCAEPVCAAPVGYTEPDAQLCSEDAPPASGLVEDLINPAADPADVATAVGHYAEEPVLGESVPTSAVDRVALLAGDQQAEALRDMGEDEFQDLLDQVPAGDQAGLESLLQNCDDPERKLALWRTYHTSMNDRELDELSPESEIGEDPDRQAERVRRETILSDTESELADEVAALDAAGTPMTLDEVDKLIARKELEHAIEMRHNLNVTTEGGTRADGSRIIWSEEELRVMSAALEQVPENVVSDPNVIREIRREDAHADGRNAQNAPQGAVISLYDNGAKTTPTNPRDHADPELVAEHGDQTSFMERVMLHEIGHSAYNQDTSNHGGVYGQATAHIPRAEHGEYFAEDFKNALINPEAHAVAAMDEPQQELAAAEQALQANPGDPAAIAAHAAAAQKAKSWQQMYSHMRDEVFDADRTEAEYADQLETAGASPEELAEFRDKAARLSTPEQIERLAAEYGF